MYLTRVAPIGDALTKKAGLPAILAVLSHHLKNARITGNADYRPFRMRW